MGMAAYPIQPRLGQRGKQMRSFKASRIPFVAKSNLAGV
jgi:hypothetical protein